MNRVFISGTTNKKELLDIGYKLQYLGYEDVYYVEYDAAERPNPINRKIRRERLKVLLNNADIFLFFDARSGGRDWEDFLFEDEIAKKIGLEIWDLKYLNQLVSEKAIESYVKELEIPLRELPEL